MIFFPAIDIKEGKCVRLLKGDMKKATIYDNKPGEQAIYFENAGCEWIHVVDLDGAIEGKPVNDSAVKDIIENTNISIELGGGIRNRSSIEYWLEKGIQRVVLGTIALTEPMFVEDACKAHPGKIAVALDSRDGKIATEGWTKESNISALELANRFEDIGVAAIIFTDINRDGALKGLNIEATLELAKGTSLPVIASGGISSMEDLEKLSKLGQGLIEGVISGRAIYEGNVDPSKAVELLRESVVKC